MIRDVCVEMYDIAMYPYGIGRVGSELLPTLNITQVIPKVIHELRNTTVTPR